MKRTRSLSEELRNIVLQQTEPLSRALACRFASVLRSDIPLRAIILSRLRESDGMGN
jgi:hypothetical protein